MAYRQYNKTSYPSQIRSGIKSRSDQRMKMFHARRGIVPGYTRTAGAYKRSRPMPASRRSEETHYTDWSISVATPATSGTIASLTSISPSAADPVNENATNSLVGISQGTTKNQRIGNKLHAYAIRFQGEITLPTAQGSNDWVRIALVLDTQSNGSAPAPTDIWEPTVAGPAANFKSFLNMDNVDRFKVLKDKRITIKQEIAVGAVPASTFVRQPWKMSHKLKDLRIDYSSTTGADTEIRSNNLVLFVFSSAGLCTVAAYSRVYWKE